MQASAAPPPPPRAPVFEAASLVVESSVTFHDLNLESTDIKEFVESLTIQVAAELPTVFTTDIEIVKLSIGSVSVDYYISMSSQDQASAAIARLEMLGEDLYTTLGYGSVTVHLVATKTINTDELCPRVCEEMRIGNQECDTTCSACDLLVCDEYRALKLALQQDLDLAASQETHGMEFNTMTIIVAGASGGVILLLIVILLVTCRKCRSGYARLQGLGGEQSSHGSQQQVMHVERKPPAMTAWA